MLFQNEYKLVVTWHPTIGNKVVPNENYSKENCSSPLKEIPLITVETEILLPSSQQSATDLYPKKDEFSPIHTHCICKTYFSFHFHLFLRLAEWFFFFR
jgi:hypothetical protein